VTVRQERLLKLIDQLQHQLDELKRVVREGETVACLNETKAVQVFADEVQRDRDA
jgi:hypothetical protein